MRTKDFWKRVKLLSKEKRVTQQMVAEATGIPVSTFKNWMCRETIPPLDYTVVLSRYFGVSIDYLVYGNEAKVSVKIKEAQVSLRTVNCKLKEIRRSS